jgi:hypothetical protein
MVMLVGMGKAWTGKLGQGLAADGVRHGHGHFHGHRHRHGQSVPFVISTFKCPFLTAFTIRSASRDSTIYPYGRRLS